MGEIKNLIVDTVCPHCHKTEKAKIWVSFNSKENPKITKKVIDDTFFNKECSNCGKLYYLDFTTICRDENQEKAICYISSNEEFVDIAVTFDNKDIPDMYRKIVKSNLRLVRDRNVFREKVRIFSMDMDDRVIEVLKVYAIETVRKHGYEGEIKQVLCWITDDNELCFTFFDSHAEVCTEGLTLPFDTYVSIDNVLKELFAEKGEPGYIIDLDWAMEFVAENEI